MKNFFEREKEREREKDKEREREEGGRERKKGIIAGIYALEVLPSCRKKKALFVSMCH